MKLTHNVILAILVTELKNNVNRLASGHHNVGNESAHDSTGVNAEATVFLN
jgi:hypothetical protein